MQQKIILTSLNIEELHRGKYQTRRQFDKSALEELAQSIRSNGIIQPIVVRPSAQGYEIIAGERRWQAAQIAGLAAIPCLVKDYNDAQTAAITAIENLNRADLNAIEEAEAYQRLLEEFDYSHEELAAIVGKSRSRITNSLRLLKLDKKIQEWVIAGVLTEGHVKVLASLDRSFQHLLAGKAIAQQWSVRRMEKEVQKFQKNVEKNLAEKWLDPNLTKLEQSLSDFIGSPVKLEWTPQSKKMIINFFNLEILEGFFEKLGFRIE